MKAMRKVCVCQLRNHVFYLYLSYRHIGIESVSNNASVIYNGSQFKFRIRPQLYGSLALTKYKVIGKTIIKVRFEGNLFRIS
jgi:hypothetical protein